MTWIHCSIKDGSTVALSVDDGFHAGKKIDSQGRHPISDEMLKSYFHVHVDEPLSNLRPLIRPVLNESSEIAHKFRGVIDIDTIFTTASQRSRVRNPSRKVNPVKASITRSDIQERQAVGDPIPSVAPQD